MKSNVMYSAKILGRAINYIWRKFDRDERGHERGWHGRFSAYLDEHANRQVRVEYHAPATRCALALDVDDEDITLHIGLPPVQVFVSVEGPEVDRLAKWLIGLERSDMGFSYGGRALSFSVNDWAVWWKLWVDDAGWTNSRPRWRDGCWYPLGREQRKGNEVEVARREVVVPMPERGYRGIAKLTRARYGFTRLPAFLDQIIYGVHIEMHPGEQIPHPGKGENSWDCGEDATYSISGAARTIEDGVGMLVASVLRSRRKYGGPVWTPQPVAAA